MNSNALNQLLNNAVIALKSGNRNRSFAIMREIEKYVPGWRRSNPRSNLYLVLHNINTWPSPPPSPVRRRSPSPPRRKSPRQAAARKIQAAFRRYKKRTRSPKTTRRIPRTNL